MFDDISAQDVSPSSAGVTPLHGPVTVLVVDRHRLVAEAMAHVLRAAPAISAVVAATTVEDATRLALEHNPVAFVLGAGAPPEVVHRLRAVCNAPTVTVAACRSDGQSAPSGGTTTLSNRTAGAEDLTCAVLAATGLDVATADTEAKPVRRLSGREREILQLLVHGSSTQEIADRLFLSTHTVRNHVRNILGKLGAHTKLEAIVKATRLGLISLEQRAS
jgi:DNA-binding NarL/FixJ family response regulator